jgi:hypothetical protein
MVLCRERYHPKNSAKKLTIMQIYFRVWSNSDKRYLKTDELHEKQVNVPIPMKDGRTRNKKVSLMDAILFFNYYGYELQPYAGHNDKNGKGIYLGDKVRITRTEDKLVLVEDAKVIHGWYQKHGEDPQYGFLMEGKNAEREWEQFTFVRSQKYPQLEFEVIGNDKEKNPTPTTPVTRVNTTPSPVVST